MLNSKNQHHPATAQVHRFLSTIIDKDIKGFASFFDLDASFTNILPSGRRIVSGIELIKERSIFFASPVTRFEHGPLIDVVEDTKSFAAGTQAQVIRVDGSELKLYLRLTFVLAHCQRWIPRLIQNTIMEA